jgi:membrane protease YdiL (CAAX protease family)
MADDHHIRERSTGIGDRLSPESLREPTVETAPAATELSLPAVSWSAVEIVGVIIFGMAGPLLLYQFLRWSGWYGQFYGADFIHEFDLLGMDVIPDWLGWFCGLDLPEQLRQWQNRARQITQTRLMLWAFCAALPVQVACTLALLRSFSGTKPADIGLTGRRLGVNLLAGVIAALVLVPGVYGIQALVVLLVRMLGGAGQEHPFAKLGETSLYPTEWVLLVLAATVVAPVWEELLFRGVIQPWVISRRFGGVAAFGAALAVTLSARMEYLTGAADRLALLVQLLPILILLALLPVYGLLAERSRQAGGLFASAVLFAWIHASVWPSPIPLLWLGLGLGWLAMRTRSLVGPIVLHALFNGVACLVLLFS